MPDWISFKLLTNPKVWMGLILAAVLATAAIQTVQLRHSQSEAKALTEALADAQAEVILSRSVILADRGAQDDLRAATAVITQEGTKRSERIEKALRASQDWADQPVPRAVIDGLHNPGSDAGGNSTDSVDGPL